MALVPDTKYYALPQDGTDDLGISTPLSLQALMQQLGMASPSAPAAAGPIVPPASPRPGISPAVAALMRDPGMSAGPVLPPPSLTDPAYSNAPSVPTPLPASPPPPAPGPTMPQLPHHREDRLLRIVGAIAALSGGPGGRIIAQGLAQRDARDQAEYQRQVQEQQQQFTNQTAQANASEDFLHRLAQLDDGSQESAVRNLTPSQMSAYGWTPEQVQKQFFGADGKFVPLTATDAKAMAQQAQLQRSQTYARARLSADTVEGQQTQHDAYAANPDLWEQTFGIPYGTWQPSQTQRDVTAATVAGNRETDAQRTAGIQQSKAQTAAYNELSGQTVQAQRQRHALYASNPEAWEVKYGVPWAGWQPGQKQSDVNTATGIANRHADAQASDATRIRIANLNIAARAAIDRANNAVTMRGQDLRNQMNNASINARVRMFNERYGQQNSGAAEKQYQKLLETRMKIQKEMTRLSTPGKDPLTGEPTLSIRDQGRIDENGNIVQNPVPTAAYNQYMYLQQQDQQLAAEQSRLLPPGGSAAPAAPTVSFAPAPASGSLPPAPVNVPSTILHPTTPVKGPIAPPLPYVPDFVSHPTHGSSSTLPSFAPSPLPKTSAKPVKPSGAQGVSRAVLDGDAKATPAQRAVMTDDQLKRYFAMRLLKKYGLK